MLGLVKPFVDSPGIFKPGAQSPQAAKICVVTLYIRKVLAPCMQ